MAEIEVDTTELDDLVRIFERRSDHMIIDALREGMTAAQNFQASQVAHPGIKHARIMRRRQPRATASAALQARFIERALYYRLVDFFGQW